MVINNYCSYVGKPRLTLTRNGNTLTVKTSGSIPLGYYVCMCYSTPQRSRRGKKQGRRRTNRCNRGRKAFTADRSARYAASANSTYTFSLLTPWRWSKVMHKEHFKVRAELRNTNMAREIIRNNHNLICASNTLEVFV
jgi:hypothetical protein